MMWKVISEQDLHFHSWDDECVVYNNLSGDTHLLSLAAAQILLKLKEAPSNAALLAVTLAPLWQVDPDQELALQIENILSDLNAIALIEPVQS